MNHHPKMTFFPLCDLHHCPMRPVMLEGSAAEETRPFHQCERRDCDRIFRDGEGYTDFCRRPVRSIALVFSRVSHLWRDALPV